MLLPSGPDTVRGSSLRGTRSSTSLEAAACKDAVLGWEFSPAGADCRFRAPLVPRLARPAKSSRDASPGGSRAAIRVGRRRTTRTTAPESRRLAPLASRASAAAAGDDRPPGWCSLVRAGESVGLSRGRIGGGGDGGGPSPATGNPSGRPIGDGEAGGEGGIRTRDGLPRTAFPVRRHSPLGDLSPERIEPTGRRRPARHESWRRGRDSNPRCFRTPLFESGTINHSDTSPRERIANVGGGADRTIVLAGLPRARPPGAMRWPWCPPGAPPPRRGGCR